MTDKKLIKQEIERRIAEGSSKNYISEGALTLESLLDFIDSLPEEPASEDLEEEIENYLDYADFKSTCNGIYAAQDYFEDITNTAHHFAEWQKQKSMQDFLEKAEDAISMISRHYIGEDYTFDQIWEQFKNYMQNESEN